MIKLLRMMARMFYMAGEQLERMADRWPETRERIEDKVIDLSLDLEDVARLAGMRAAEMAARASRTSVDVARTLTRYLVRVWAWMALQVVVSAHRAYKTFRALLPVFAGYARRMPGAWREAWSWREDLLTAS